jgi:hypothetical protein
MFLKGKDMSNQLRITMGFAILVGFFQALVTINFFYPPFLTPNSTAYVKLLIPSLLFLYLFIVALAIYMVRLYINKWKVTLRYYKAMKEDEKMKKQAEVNRKRSIVTFN